MNFINQILSKRGYHLFKEGFMQSGIFFDNDLKKIINISGFKTVFDVGAYHGNMTDRFLQAFYNADIIAIEPSPHSFSFLREKFITNTKVRLINCGVGNIRSSFKFKLFENGELNSFKEIPNDEAESVESIEVEIETIDNIVRKYPVYETGIDFLKIDVEGFEMECLTGASELFSSNNIGSVFIESGFCDDDNRHTSFSLITNFLKKYGFSFYGLYDLYHYRKPTELLFANALFINEKYFKNKGLLKNK